MKIVIRTLLFHLLSIIIFTFIYFNINTNFTNQINNNVNIYDFFLLATTIQVGVGYSSLYPTTDISKLVIIMQQFCMLSTHIITLYFFTI
jgi:hypothetical protein